MTSRVKYFHYFAGSVFVSQSPQAHVSKFYYKNLQPSKWTLDKCDVQLNPGLAASNTSPWTILGFHVTSPNSRIQNWEAYKIFTFIQGKIT